MSEPQVVANPPDSVIGVQARTSWSFGSLSRFVTLGAVASLTNVVVSIARNKTLALSVGPEGIGIIGEASQIAALGLTLGSLASALALGGAMANAVRDNDPARARACASTSLYLGLSLAIFGACVSVILAPWILPVSGWPISVRWVVAAVATSCLVAVPAGVLTVTMAALEDTVGSTASALVSTVIGAVLTVYLAATFGLVGAIISIVASGLVTLIATCAIAWRNPRGRAYQALSLAWDRSHARLSIAIGAGTILGALAQQGSLLGIRAVLEGVGRGLEGAALNGQFQAAFAMEALFFSVGMTGLFNFVWPQFATARTPFETTALIDQISAFVLRIFPIGALALVLVRYEVITLFFSERFHAAAELLGWYLAAVTTKALYHAYAAPLSYAKRPGRFALTNLVGAALVAATTVPAVLYFGLVGVGIGHFSATILQLLMVLVVTRRTCQITVPVARIFFAIGLGFTIRAIDHVTEQMPFLRWGLFVVLIGWLAHRIVSSAQFKARWVKFVQRNPS